MSPRKRTKDKHLPERVYYKHGAYYFIGRDPDTGKNKWVKLGKTMSDAMIKWAQIVESPLADDTMNAIFDRYLLEIAPQKAPRTYHARIRAIKYLRPAFAHFLPHEVTPIDIYEYLDARAKVSVFSANKEKSVLSHVFTCAIRWGKAKSNPCRDVQSLPEPVRDRHIEDWEFGVTYKEASPLLQAMMRLAYVTALREGDLF